MSGFLSAAKTDCPITTARIKRRCFIPADPMPLDASVKPPHLSPLNPESRA